MLNTITIMVYYRIINNTRWYYRLKPHKETDGKVKRGLFSDTPRHTLTNALIVAWSYHDVSSGKVFLLFSHFKSYLEYGIYQLKLPPHERCFYEIILGESTQKPHFDIDIKSSTGSIIDGESIKDNLIDGIVKVLSDKGININIATDILIYTSHNEKKQSYHIVVNNYCHANNIEARAFYDAVMDHVDPIYTEAGWIDKAVYSPTQQFRIVGSQKSDQTELRDSRRYGIIMGWK